MVPAESVFQGFRKMVRDLARDEGKEIDFRVSGLEIEADRWSCRPSRTRSCTSCATPSATASSRRTSAGSLGKSRGRPGHPAARGRSATA